MRPTNAPLYELTRADRGIVTRGTPVTLAVDPQSQWSFSYEFCGVNNVANHASTYSLTMGHDVATNAHERGLDYEREWVPLKIR